MKNADRTHAMYQTEREIERGKKNTKLFAVEKMCAENVAFNCPIQFVVHGIRYISNHEIGIAAQPFNKIHSKKKHTERPTIEGKQHNCQSTPGQQRLLKCLAE